MHIVDLFDRGARGFPRRLAFCGAGGDFTFAQAQSLSNRIARAFLANNLGVGTRFAALSPNCGQAMIATLGGARAGGVWCNINLRTGLEDKIDTLKRGACNVLFYHSSVSEEAAAIVREVDTLRASICLDARDAHGDYLHDWIEGQTDAPVGVRIPEDEIGVQGATGGTTGLPKLAVGSNRMLQMSVLAWVTCLHYDSPPVNLAIAPITHAGGVVALAHLPLGGTSVMMAGVGLEEILQSIGKYGATTLFLPPTVIYMLLAHPRVRDHDYSSLRYFISAAAPIAPDKLAEAVDVFGPVMAQAYGQTESGFPLTYMGPGEIAEAVADEGKRHRLLSCGRPTLIVEAMEIMDDDGNILPAGQNGELVLRAPTTMVGYLNDPQATEEAQKFGWHHTGDIGYRDEDGYFYINDRKRDMIVSGGFNIFPFEIEQVLLKHPAIQDCAVVGVPDEKWGEAVKAVVELAPGQTVTEAELIAACRDVLGGMKAPKSIDFTAALPRSAVGKVLKRELREKYWQGHGRRVG